MATQNLQNISPISLNAGESIAAGQPCKIGSADKTVIKATANTDIIVGISLVSAAADEQVPLQDDGIAKLQAGGTITRGDRVMWVATGKVVTATSGRPVIGYALESAVSGDWFAVQLTLPSLTLAP